VNRGRSIQDVSLSFGLTSRTLRYWEQRGLFTSTRDPSSAWRFYDDRALRRIRLAVQLRRLDLPIKGIKRIFDEQDLKAAARVVAAEAARIESEMAEAAGQKEQLYRCLDAIAGLGLAEGPGDWYESLENALSASLLPAQSSQTKQEGSVMARIPCGWDAVRIVSLPAMRAAVCNVVSEAPEEEALKTVLAWVEEAGLLGTARIFGFNTTPYSPGDLKYGWAAAVTIPEGTEVPAPLEEKRLPGGLYAAFPSTHEIYDSWQYFTGLLQGNREYRADPGRPCLEEHIRSGESPGQGHEFHLTLLEPVVRR
jgi:DNA-binding transcriptional MerR regulator/DNA gyrase inhibitor GyrI